jgi:cell division septation protein DedD
MSGKYLVAAVIAGLLSAPLYGQSVKAGIEAWQHADYDGAVSIWRPLAEKGDPDAQFNLGQAYRLGRGVPINLALAKSWFERAAANGHLDAETTLGLLLFQNGDQASGLKWLRQAAQQGEPRAQLVYGTALYNGDGVSQDRTLGYAYVSRAAGQGLVPARETLAQLDGLMNPGERSKALALLPTISSANPAAARSASGTRSSRGATSPAPRAVRKAARPSADPLAPRPEPAKAPAQRRSASSAGGPVGGNWRIQLGAFSQRGAAEMLYHRLSGRAALAGRKPTYVAAGKIIRLQVGPYESRAAAEAACRTVGSACFPVQAR